ncbi:MAG: hypothetical protein K0R67_3961, partial [Paenibacillus sp.]|nr:hypothetical protein [Paenibacillus sp.]
MNQHSKLKIQLFFKRIEIKACWFGHFENKNT